MGRVLWAWCFAWLLLLGFAASARAQELGLVPVCVLPPDVPEDIARNGWAFAPNGTMVLRMRREEFQKASRDRTIFVFNPAAPAENTKLLPIRYHHLKCDPYTPPKSAPAAPSATPTAGPPPPPPAAGGTSGAAPKPGQKKPAAAEKDEPPPGTPPPIVYPKNDPEPKPRPPNNGVTAHWPTSVLPLKQPKADDRTRVLPVATVLPFKQPEAADRPTVLPTAHVLPFKHEVNKASPDSKGDGGGSSTGKAPNKVAKKTMFAKIAEQAAIAGAMANTQMNADLNRPDGKRFGIVGGTNPNGPNNPTAQASAGVVLVAAAALSAGASKLVKKLETALAKKTPLLYDEMKEVGEKVADELVTKLGPKLGAEEVRAGLAQALNENGAIGAYSVMKQFTDKLGGKYQAHHILEVQFAKKFRLGNPDKVPSVILTDAQHKAVTAELAAETVKARTAQELWKAYQKVYKKYPPHWLEAIKPYFAKGQ